MNSFYLSAYYMHYKLDKIFTLTARRNQNDWRYREKIIRAVFVLYREQTL